jgi:hypothetical protein
MMKDYMEDLMGATMGDIRGFMGGMGTTMGDMIKKVG